MVLSRGGIPPERKNLSKCFDPDGKDKGFNRNLSRSKKHTRSTLRVLGKERISIVPEQE